MLRVFCCWEHAEGTWFCIGNRSPVASVQKLMVNIAGTESHWHSSLQVLCMKLSLRPEGLVQQQHISDVLPSGILCGRTKAQRL